MILKRISLNNAVFTKALGNMTKHRDKKLLTTGARRNYLVSQLNYHSIKSFSENLLAIEMKKTEIIKNKPVDLGLSILELSKLAMYTVM